MATRGRAQRRCRFGDPEQVLRPLTVRTDELAFRAIPFNSPIGLVVSRWLSRLCSCERPQTSNSASPQHQPEIIASRDLTAGMKECRW